LMAEQL